MIRQAIKEASIEKQINKILDNDEYAVVFLGKDEYAKVDAAESGTAYATAPSGPFAEYDIEIGDIKKVITMKEFKKLFPDRMI